MNLIGIEAIFFPEKVYTSLTHSFSEGEKKKNSLKKKNTIFGIFVIYLNPLLKDIPIKLAEWMSDVSIKNKFIPIIYLIIFFFGLPFLIILIGR